MLTTLTVLALSAVVLIAIDLLGNSEIFQPGAELGPGTGSPSPYERLDDLSCDTELQFTQRDRQRASETVEDLHILLGSDPVGRLYSMSAKDRLSAAKELHKRLCNRFGLDLQLQFGTSDTGTCGAYIHNRKTLWLEYRYLMSTDPAHIVEYLDTVIHEFRHAMQHQFIRDSTYNEASEEYRARMARSLHPNVYVSFAENPELYFKQLCEREARAYADMVMQLLNGGN